jgi:hypothetical protein
MKYEGHEAYMKRRLEEDQLGLFPTTDMVNNPPHYNQAGIECLDAIRAATFEGYEFYLQGNILKYLWRYRYKNGVEDLKKAQFYLNKLILEYEPEE